MQLLSTSAPSISSVLPHLDERCVEADEVVVTIGRCCWVRWVGGLVTKPSTKPSRNAQIKTRGAKPVCRRRQGQPLFMARRSVECGRVM